MRFIDKFRKWKVRCSSYQYVHDLDAYINWVQDTVEDTDLNPEDVMDIIGERATAYVKRYTAARINHTGFFAIEVNFSMYYIFDIEVDPFFVITSKWPSHIQHEDIVNTLTVYGLNQLGVYGSNLPLQESRTLINDLLYKRN